MGSYREAVCRIERRNAILARHKLQLIPRMSRWSFWFGKPSTYRFGFWANVRRLF